MTITDNYGIPVDATMTTESSSRIYNLFTLPIPSSPQTFLVIGIDRGSGPKFYPTFDPIWGSIGPMSQKIWVKIILLNLIFLNFWTGSGRGRPSGNVWVDLPDVPLKYGPEYDKPFQSY